MTKPTNGSPVSRRSVTGANAASALGVAVGAGVDGSLGGVALGCSLGAAVVGAAVVGVGGGAVVGDARPITGRVTVWRAKSVPFAVYASAVSVIWPRAIGSTNARA